MLAQLEIKFTDGTNQTIISDDKWRWCNDGAIRFADNKDGEIIDANKIPSYRGTAIETKCDVIPTASNNVFVTEHETFTPEMTVAPSGKRILDFKQNIAGYIAFRINAKGGERITLRCGEMLDENGELTLKNIQCSNKKKTTPLQKVEYTCRSGENNYKTKFAIFGFQYVEVETSLEIDPNDFTAIAVYSDLEETGKFDSSNNLLTGTRACFFEIFPIRTQPILWIWLFGGIFIISAAMKNAVCLQPRCSKDCTATSG